MSFWRNWSSSVYRHKSKISFTQFLSIYGYAIANLKYQNTNNRPKGVIQYGNNNKKKGDRNKWNNRKVNINT